MFTICSYDVFGKIMANQNAKRGRAALTNDSSRFDQEKREAFDDGWDIPEEEPSNRREIILDHPKTILAKNDSPDLPFDRSINPYRGCEHGCIYCFARPTHCYLGYSAGLDFETKIHVKPQAVTLLNSELAKPSYHCKPIAMGTNTDPWQPLEAEHQITRDILSYLLERRHPVSIVTKGTLINRDIDILSELAKHNLVHVYISVTTLNNHLHRQMEPRAMAPHKRLATIKALREAGIPTGVLAAPMIPRLNDMELEQILSEAHEAGAMSAKYLLVRLPLEVAALFRDWLDEHYPDRAEKVIKHIQDTRDGEMNNSEFFNRHRGNGVYASLLKRRFQIAHKRLGFADTLPELRVDQFRKPPADARQLELF